MAKNILNFGFVLSLLIAVSSCNTKDEYFEKQNINVTQGGSVDSGDGDLEGNTGDSLEGNIPADSKEITETFRQSSERSNKLDIVWIMDNSSSMKDEQTALGSNFSAFIDNFIMKDVDFKMAITTTDTSSSEKKGMIVGGSDLKLTSIKAQEDASLFKENFRNLINVGIKGSGNESGLAASEGFMDKHAKKFLRPEAYLAVVIVSDEEDHSEKKVEYYTEHLKKFKSSKGLVKVYSIVDVNTTKASYSGSRYKDASKQTSGLIGNIKDDFHSVLTTMGDSIINLLDSFALANRPVEGSLKVYVNGRLSNDYTYDASSLSIKFDESYLPPEGAEIKIKYLKK